MIPLHSPIIENVQGRFADVESLLDKEGFQLGGAYEYDHGYFDKALDRESDAHQSYLRVPVSSVKGRIGDPNATVKLGRPFVLRHEFQAGPDDRVNTGVFSGLIDQFQEPAVKDAPVDEKWIDRAQSALRELETRIQNGFRD
ncbi:hypothetical protein JIR001_26780 [Polycladomyces abyssicola]|uniref:YugN-like family protein n=1 Tax=Polycladomyces abyssicola TaxID=1125966 RepID=A0A8D5UGM4_9BACL|nr:YugN family protein [Polycladomyces abyssicola]BCU82895.1 hypothetical protein JIR001_26780 [Polycladomyces abyssicola]